MLRHTFLTPARAHCSKETPKNTAALRVTLLYVVSLGLAFCCVAKVRAAPFINLWIEARKQGSDDDFASNVNVALGDTIEYRVRVDTAPIGAQNVQFGRERTITQLLPGRDGINSLSLITLLQSPEELIQTHFNAPADMVNGWQVGTGSRGGVPTPRADLPWNDLVEVRAVQGPGVFSAIDPETAFMGSFAVAEVAGPFAQLKGVSLTIKGAVKINGGTVFVDPRIDDPADPYFVISPLTLTSHYDVADQQLTVSYVDDAVSPAATLREQLISGRGGPGMGNGLWTGPGITSSAAAAANAINPESRAVGYADSPAAPSGDLAAAGENDPSIIIRYTRTGDANLDGVVNDDDLTILGANYAPGVANPHWALGDFDYNGFVDDDDVTLLGAFYDPAAAPLNPPAEPGANSARFAMAVPEPATFVLFMIAGCAATVCIAAQYHRRSRFSRRLVSSMM
jgi:hypothetical protein